MNTTDLRFTIDPQALDRINQNGDSAREAAALLRQRIAEVRDSEAGLKTLDRRLLAGDDSIEPLEYATAGARFAIAERLTKHATGAAQRAERKAEVRDLDTAEAAAFLMRELLEGLPTVVTDRLPATFTKSKLPAVWVVQGRPTTHLGGGYLASDATVHLIGTSRLVTGPTVQQIGVEARKLGWINAGVTGQTLPSEIAPGIWQVSWSVGGQPSTAAMHGPAPRMEATPDGAQRRAYSGTVGLRMLLTDFLSTLDPRRLGYSGKDLDCLAEIRHLGSAVAGEAGVLWQRYGIAAQPVGCPAEWSSDALLSLKGKLLPGVGAVHEVKLLDREPFPHNLGSASFAEVRVAYRKPHQPLDLGAEDDSDGAGWGD